MYRMTEEEKSWRRRDDARTLAMAEQIKADKERYNEAIKGAREIAKEEISRVQGIAKVAGMSTKVPKKNPPTFGEPVPNFKARRSNPATIK